MTRLEKDGGVKILSDESKLIDKLLADGWVKMDEAPKEKKKVSKKDA